MGIGAPPALTKFLATFCHNFSEIFNHLLIIIQITHIIYSQNPKLFQVSAPSFLYTLVSPLVLVITCTNESNNFFNLKKNANTNYKYDNNKYHNYAICRD